MGFHVDFFMYLSMILVYCILLFQILQSFVAQQDFQGLVSENMTLRKYLQGSRHYCCLMFQKTIISGSTTSQVCLIYWLYILPPPAAVQQRVAVLAAKQSVTLGWSLRSFDFTLVQLDSRPLNNTLRILKPLKIICFIKGYNIQWCSFSISKFTMTRNISPLYPHLCTPLSVQSIFSTNEKNFQRSLKFIRFTSSQWAQNKY